MDLEKLRRNNSRACMDVETRTQNNRDCMDVETFTRNNRNLTADFLAALRLENMTRRKIE